MALKKSVSFEGYGTITSKNGTIRTGLASAQMNCYIKVLFVNATKDKASACVSFKDGENEFQKNYDFTVNLEGGNFIKQAYDHLKSLPEFAGAQDC